MAKKKRKDEAMLQTAEDRERDRVVRLVTERERGEKGTATVERLLRAGKKDEGFEVAPTGRQRLVDAPLDRLRKEGRITGREFDAGDQYRNDAYLAAIDPSAPTVDWNSVGTAFRPKSPSMFSTQRIADARIKWRETEKNIRGLPARVLDSALIHEHPFEEIGRHVFGEGNEHYARAAAKAGLRVALSVLADYYGK